MNKKETIQLITFLAGNYDSIANKAEGQKKIMVNTWYECLKDLDFRLVMQSVKKSIIESPYPPTIHDIRKNAVALTSPKPVMLMEAWNECYKMIRNGIYMTQEEFDSHSDICKKFFGSLTQLRAYSTRENNLDVVRSNFLKQGEIIAQREQKTKLMPQDMKSIVEGLTAKMDIHRLEDVKEKENDYS